MISKSINRGLFVLRNAGLGCFRFESRVGLIGFFPGLSGVATLRVIGGRPNPEKRPDRMKGEETDPPGRVNGIRVRVIPRLGQVIGDIVNRDHSVSEDQDDKDEDRECKIAQKVHGGQLLTVKCLGVEGNSYVFPSIFVYLSRDNSASLFDRLNSHSQRQCLLDFSRTKKSDHQIRLTLPSTPPCQCRDRTSPQLSDPGKAQITLAPIAA